MSWYDQEPADVRLADGPADLAAMLEGGSGGTVVVVDVLSYSTCVSVAVAGGAEVLPIPWRDERAGATAAAAGALLAGPRSLTEPSLSPTSLLGLPAGTLLALPSPNGARLTLEAAELPGVLEVYVGSLRNAGATAEKAAAGPWPIWLVAAGERWPGDLHRPALEDRIGAGVIARRLELRGLTLSAEARAAADLDPALVPGCASARELIDGGFGADVALACEIDADVDAAALQSRSATPRRIQRRRFTAQS